MVAACAPLRQGHRCPAVQFNMQRSLARGRTCGVCNGGWRRSVHVATSCPPRPLNAASAATTPQRARDASAATRREATSASTSRTDVVALGNICLDIVVPMEKLPSSEGDERQRVLDALTAAPPSQEAWEVGGNCNFMIAAARLGLVVGSVGHIGNDVYGQYVDGVLQVRPWVGRRLGGRACMYAWVAGLVARACIHAASCVHGI
eukprot:364109-Chlamydomonas_euryale.AAC.12